MRILVFNCVSANCKQLLIPTQLLRSYTLENTLNAFLYLAFSTQNYYESWQTESRC